MSTIFEQVKEQASLLEVIAFYAEDGLKQCGEHTFELSDRSCPFCGHFDCFKVKSEDEHTGFYKCFSCEATGDAIKFVQEYKKISALDAAKLIAKDFKIKVVERKVTKEEKLLYLAAEYYHSRLLDTGERKILNGMTPLKYQTSVRGHKIGTLVEFKIGYADGGLCDYLQSTGQGVQDIVEAGLGILKEGGKLVDFLGYDCFIYPQYVGGICSHLSRKDPSKQNNYQLAKKFRRNGITFYNQDSLRKQNTVYIVEGENDLLSMYDHKVDGAIIASCGSLGAPHEKFLQEVCHDKQIVTLFDGDDAGDKYREKIAELFPEATHIKLPGPEKDIDDYLRAGKPFSDVFSHAVKVTSKKSQKKLTGIEVPSGETPSVNVRQTDVDVGIVEQDRCYYRLKMDKDGNPNLFQLTDFVFSLRSVYVVEGRRNREVVIERDDGFKSRPILIDSETKISVKSFKTKIADACDANFYGTEVDLTNLWRYVYKKSSQRTVLIPDFVGHLTAENEGGWLFSNCYIRRDGEILTPDKNGVMWVNGNTHGIRPKTISATLDAAIYSDNNRDIPKICHNIPADEREAVTKILCHMYAKNLGDTGKALTMLGWAMMSAFSDRLFEKYGFIPFLFGWGGHGTGKTTLLEWLLAIYGMKSNGYSTLPGLRSGVGMERKLAYYASLPVCIDELRAGKDLVEFAGRFRSWYQRVGRTMGAANSHKEVIQQEVRSNFIFGGQDIFTDDALRSRTIVIRIPKEDRELKESYKAIKMLETSGKISAVGFSWILEAMKEDYDALFAEIDELVLRIADIGSQQRNSQVWAMVGVFGRKLATRYFPEFDFDKYLLEACSEDTEVQQESNFLTRFFETVEGVLYQQHSPLTVEHLKVENNKLYMWFTDIFRIISAQKRDSNEETFTKEAIKSALKEESYYKEETISKMGINSTSRRVMVFDLTSPGAPQSLKSIAHFAKDL